MGKNDRKARSRSAQQAAEARRRKEELRRRRKGRIAGLIAFLAGLAVIVVFVIGTQDNDDGDSEPARGGGQRAAGGNGECDFDVEPPENRAQQYDQPATQEQVLSPGVDYRATIETNCGSIEIDLLEEEAPSTVANFIFLAEDGYYDGLTWHRVIDEFVIQGGDPEGDGSGGPGYQFDDELPEQSNVYTFGALAMANSGPNTNGSQFFFVTHDADAALEGKNNLQPAGLQPLYSYFGRASEESFPTLDALQKVETSTEQATQDRPVEPLYILSVDIQAR
ncbi:MAG: peptidylprolyl isomerase [Actinomycetota bacterium]